MIRDIHTQLVGNEVTAVELAQKSLAHIDHVNPHRNAFISTLKEMALAAARDVDAKIARGEPIDALAGIPCAVKDNICVRGARTTAASKMLETYVAPYDATVVTRLRAKDVVMVGKTNMDEFACGGSTENSAYGVTTHPLDATRVAGGSSGGSAAAVADGSIVWALGTDTGGSIRQPASFCGVVGLKPTYGRVSRYGVIAMGSSLDQVGPITKTVEDAAIVLSCIAGRDVYDATTAHSADKPYEEYCVGSVRGARIGIPREYLGEGLDERVRAVFMAAVEQYKKLGAEIVDISLPHTPYALAVYYIIMPCELSSNLARYDGLRYGGTRDTATADETLLDRYLHVRGNLLGAEVKRRVMLGTYALSAGYYDAYYKKAQKVRYLIREDFRAAFDTVDYIFTPTTPEVAFAIGAKMADPLTMYLSDIYTVTANLAGVPALSLPIGTVEESGVALPVGGQLIGKWFDEEGILNAGHTYEITTQAV